VIAADAFLEKDSGQAADRAGEYGFGPPRHFESISLSRRRIELDIVVPDVARLTDRQSDGSARDPAGEALSGREIDQMIAVGVDMSRAGDEAGRRVGACDRDLRLARR